METSTETQYLKCNGCKCLRAEDEYEMYKGTRRKTCLKCKANRAKYQEASKCTHGRRKTRCKECGGSQICSHGRQKNACKECGGASICTHGRHKSSCRECGGSQICEHGRYKTVCRECGGSQICEHGRQKGSCKICNLELCLITLQRSAIRRMLINSNLSKVKHTIEYLGCDSEYFKEYITKKMTDGMTWQNIHIDHIKPVSKFNLDDPDQFLDCCHYTNLQPLMAVDNLKKSNIWSEENEKYWLEHIKGKEYYPIYNTT